MPKNAARKKLARDRQHATGEPYNVARRHDEEGLPFDPSWLHLDVTLCPVCHGENVEWVLRGSERFGFDYQPGQPTDFIRPTDPGFCFDCHSNGQASEPDLWRVSNGIEADSCPECRQPPTSQVHLPWNDGKHRRNTNCDDSLVPSDGRWYRYECPDGHWWVSAPSFTTVSPIISVSPASDIR